MSIQSIYTDKRQFNRIAFDAPVTLHSDDGDWGTTLIDISLKGVLILRPDNWDYSNNEEFNISVELDGHDSEINMNVKQVHIENETLGLQCVSIDLESVAILKRLVELNLGDEQILDREIANMMTG
jgi:PilZ domain